jgi:hypothetical protein
MATRTSGRSAQAGSLAFLCYRSEDTSYARHLWKALSDEIGSERIFWDMNKIAGGENYEERIEIGLEASDAVVVLIGRDWLQTDGSPDSGINDPADPVRMEIRVALEQEKPILPVLVGGVDMPARKLLPPDIAKLEKFHAMRLTEDHWDVDLGNVVTKVVSILDSEPRQRRLQRPTIGRSQPSTPAGAPTRAAPRPTGVVGTRPPTINRALPRVPSPTTPNFTLGLNRAPSTLGSFSGPRLDTDVRSPYDRWINSPAAEEVRERVRQETAAREAARQTQPAFYERAEFWITAAVTLIACLIFALAADPIIVAVVRAGGLQVNPVDWGPAAWLMGIIWASLYIGLGTASYFDDPRLGPSVFVTRGAFGWIGVLREGEPIAALLGTFPLTMILGWGIARAFDEGAKAQLSIGWLGVIVLALYTLFATTRYGEEALDAW